MTLGGPRCSAESLDRAESLHATASLVSAWLLVEQPGAWGPEALKESKFPHDVADQLLRRAGGVRILLIRRRDSSENPVFFKANSGAEGRAPVLLSEHLSDPADLLAIDFEALTQGDPGSGLEVTEPMYLVCTHGRHDICCADQGRPLYRALSEIRPDQTWEVSHLGGDRFAGNVLVLPRGDYFGRVGAEGSEALVAGYEAGRLDLAHHRGRSTQPRLVQAAEHFVREAEALPGFDDLTVTRYSRSDHDHAVVVFEGPTGEFRVEVVARDLPGSVLTCRSEQPAHPVTYDLVSMTGGSS